MEETKTGINLYSKHIKRHQTINSKGLGRQSEPTKTTFVNIDKVFEGIEFDKSDEMRAKPFRIEVQALLAAKQLQ